MFGNYHHSASNWPGFAIDIMLGSPYTERRHSMALASPDKKNELWGDIKRYLKAGHMVTSSTSGEHAHSFSVVGAQAIG